jgi:flagellar P-ring protein precursor FlgI
MITAELPAFTKVGQTLDITVSTMGGANSLRGGTLLMSPLLGADGETYAIAQGNLVVGGLGVQGADQSSLVVNVPTVGRIPRGASVERMVPSAFLETPHLVLNLHRGDFTTASNTAEAINSIFGPDVAVPLDANSIRVRAPVDPSQRVSFMSLMENVEVQQAEPPARVIVNSRTGTYSHRRQCARDPCRRHPWHHDSQRQRRFQCRPGSNHCDQWRSNGGCAE